MSSKLTPKQEAFCLAYMETGNASEAYRRCYNAGKMKDETINVKAYELLQNGKIGDRLNELKQPAIERAQITYESHMKKMAELRDAAYDAGQYAAAITAEHHRGKAAQLYVERSVNINENYHISDQPTEDEWEEEYLGASEGASKSTH